MKRKINNKEKKLTHDPNEELINIEEKLERSNKLYYGVIALVVTILVAVGLILHFATDVI